MSWRIGAAQPSGREAHRIPRARRQEELVVEAKGMRVRIEQRAVERACLHFLFLVFSFCFTFLRALCTSVLLTLIFFAVEYSWMGACQLLHFHKGVHIPKRVFQSQD